MALVVDACGMESHTHPPGLGVIPARLFLSFSAKNSADICDSLGRFSDYDNISFIDTDCNCSCSGI